MEINKWHFNSYNLTVNLLSLEDTHGHIVVIRFFGIITIGIFIKSGTDVMIVVFGFINVSWPLFVFNTIIINLLDKFFWFIFWYFLVIYFVGFNDFLGWTDFFVAFLRFNNNFLSWVFVWIFKGVFNDYFLCIDFLWAD